MASGGYKGKILRVNLTDSKFIVDNLPKELDGQKINKERLKYLSPKVWDRKKAGIKLQREKDKENK